MRGLVTITNSIRDLSAHVLVPWANFSSFHLFLSLYLPGLTLSYPLFLSLKVSRHLEFLFRKGRQIIAVSRLVKNITVYIKTVTHSDVLLL